MSDPNRADISVLETLQNQAHESMGLSGMAVFNDAAQTDIFNMSSNTKGILTRLPKFKVHWDNIERTTDLVKRIQSDKLTRPGSDATYDALIERTQATIRRSQGHFATEAKNIATLIDMERKRLNFDYKPGTPVSKEGIDSATYTARKQFADAVNAFHSGKLPDGTPFTAFLK